MSKPPADASPRRLSPRVIAGLDAARALATLFVTLVHVAHARTDAAWTLPLQFGQEVVTLFFVLSGFVIFYSERDRVGGSVFGYYFRRIRRVYPTLLIAMAVSAAVLASQGELQSAFSWRELIGTLLNLQDASELKPGVVVDAFLGNLPLWTLSYEVAFYAIFPAALFAWKRWPVATDHIVGAGSVLAYLSYAAAPNHLSLVTAYFLIWWTGAMVAKAYIARQSLMDLKRPLGWLAVLITTALMVVAYEKGFSNFGYYPLLPVRHFAAALLIVVIGFGPIGRALYGRCQAFAGPAAVLASLSYGIYVFHYPLLVQWKGAWTVPGFSMAAGLVLALAWLADREMARWLRKLDQRRPEMTVPAPKLARQAQLSAVSPPFGHDP